MRSNSKFNILKNRVVSLYFLKKRVFNFKRSKWKQIQKKLIVVKNAIQKIQNKKFQKKKFKYKVFKNVRLINRFNTSFNTIKVKIKAWDRIRFVFRNCLNAKTHLKSYFDGVFSTKFYKTKLTSFSIRSLLISSTAIFPEYRIDILLWRLHFFPSAYAAQKAILHKNFCINSIQIRQKQFLYLGDFLSLKSIKELQFLKNSNRYTFSNLILPHIEVDYFLGQIIIIKSWDSFVLKDFNLIIKNSLKIERVKTYFSK